MLPRACVGLKQSLEAIQLDLRRSQFRPGRRRIRSRRVHLRFRLTDVRRPGIGLQQPHLRVGRRTLGAGTGDLQLRITRVESRDHVARGYTIALLHAQLEEPPAHLRGHLDLGRLHMSRDAWRPIV